MGERWATFDCYGTLVDWLSGMRATFASLWPEADADALLASYHRIEPAIQAGPMLAYRSVMAEALWRVAATAGLTVPDDARDALGASLPGWPVFDEVPAALRELRAGGWRLAILSNTDADLLDASIRALGVRIDERIVAGEIGSYKPAPGHWEAFFARSGSDRLRHVHAAASLYHDVAPAAALGLRCVWINRLGESSPLPRAGELPDLAGLPLLLEELVPA